VKVLVGLSGGVDSAIAAYLLKEQGYNVTCCFMRNWDSALNNDIAGNPDIDNDICPQESDYNDALATAEQLGLELLRVDYIQEYWQNVFQTFLDEYKVGRTPNPDILCNKYIKFDAFLNYALRQGFDMIATGHYLKRIDADKALFYKASDLNKDQSYFLAQVNYDALAKTLFPLGNIDKTQVREIAAKLNLKIAKKKDSTGICFIGERNFKQFLSNYLPMRKGKIIDITTGKQIGEHDGVFFYTIGQRKGFNVGGSEGPYFCVGKDIYQNELYLCPQKAKEYLLSDSCLVKDINWLYGKVEGKIYAKFRYRQNDHPVTIEYLDEQIIKLNFLHDVEAVTEGQQAVLYDGDGLLLGGGIIDCTYYQGRRNSERIKENL